MYKFYELCRGLVFSTNFAFPVHREAITLNYWPRLQQNADILTDSFPVVYLYVVLNSCDSGITLGTETLHYPPSEQQGIDSSPCAQVVCSYTAICDSDFNTLRIYSQAQLTLIAIDNSTLFPLPDYKTNPAGYSSSHI
jgi:hypothetical protein